MAKGIEINGQMRGKRGGVVYYRAAGQQISRARNFAPKNPRSAAQSVQRMVLATSSKMAAALRPIVNHSWEGVMEGETSVRHFQSIAMRRLRALVAAAIDGAEGGKAILAIKGAPIAGVADGLPVSRGRLSFVPYTVDSGAVTVEYAVGTTAPLSTFTSAAEYEAALAAYGLVPGDQLTFVWYAVSGANIVARWGGFENVQDAIRYSRIVFKPSSEIDFTSGVDFLVDGRVNSALVVEQSRVQPAWSVSGGNTTYTLPRAAGLSAIGAAVVRSQKQDSGKYLYSSADLLLDGSEVDSVNWEVYGSYMSDGSDIVLGDQLYLQHAVAAPFQEAGA